MRFAAIFTLSGCALLSTYLVGCTALLDTGSLSNGHGASGAGGGDTGGADADAGASSGGQPGAAGSNTRGGGSAQGGAAGSSGSITSGGTANVAGGGTTGMGGASAGAAGASAGAGGAPCTPTNKGKERCDGVDNDCNPATPDCPAGCSAFSVFAVNYMACAKLSNWNGAEVACLDQNMELAQILSAQENDALSAKLKELKFTGSVWIGGESDPQNNTTFQWISNTVIYKNGKAVAGVYQNFAANQPASLAAPSDLQIDAAAGTWSNALPSTNQTYLCKAFTFL